MTNTTKTRKFATIEAYNTARAAMPAGPDQSAEWAKLVRRFADKAEAARFCAALLAYMQAIGNAKMQAGFASDMPPWIICDDLQIEVGNTGGFVRIVEQKRGGRDGEVCGQRMSHSFVSMGDAAATKALCARKTGDVFKCATYKAPATHVRGSIFSETSGAEALSVHGSVRHIG
jgi:hypothetical protein